MTTETVLDLVEKLEGLAWQNFAVWYGPAACVSIYTLAGATEFYYPEGHDLAPLARFASELLKLRFAEIHPWHGLGAGYVCELREDVQHKEGGK